MGFRGEGVQLLPPRDVRFLLGDVHDLWAQTVGIPLREHPAACCGNRSGLPVRATYLCGADSGRPMVSRLTLCRRNALRGASDPYRGSCLDRGNNRPLLFVFLSSGLNPLCFLGKGQGPFLCSLPAELLPCLVVQGAGDDVPGDPLCLRTGFFTREEFVAHHPDSTHPVLPDIPTVCRAACLGAWKSSPSGVIGYPIALCVCTQRADPFLPLYGETGFPRQSQFLACLQTNRVAVHGRFDFRIVGGRHLCIHCFPCAIEPTGFVLLVAEGGDWCRRRIPFGTHIVAIVLAVLIVTLSIGTMQRNMVWQDSYSLWSDAARKSPETAIARMNHGYALLSQQKMNEGLVEIQEALRLRPTPLAEKNAKGVFYAQTGLTKKPILEFHFIIAAKPDYAPAHYNLGILYDNKGWIDQAIQKYEAAIKIQPDYAEAHNNLGIALARKGFKAEAVKHLKEAIRLRPTDVEFAINLDRVNHIP